jgi:hypothetical protein
MNTACAHASSLLFELNPVLSFALLCSPLCLLPQTLESSAAQQMCTYRHNSNNSNSSAYVETSNLKHEIHEPNSQ